MNQDDCGCAPNNLSILNSQNNNLIPNNLSNNQPAILQAVNNQQMNNQQMNNQQMNNQQINNQEVNNQQMNNLPIDTQEVNIKNSGGNKKEINLFLMVLAALATNEAVKYFINKSIRLNSGTSSRYIYYAVVCVAVAILYNIL